MAKIRWKLKDCPASSLQKLKTCGNYWKICVLSLTYNHHLNQSYVADVALEPIIWIVDNYAHFLGRFFVASVAVLTFAVVFVAHWIGLPFWWEKSPALTFVLVVLGYWLLTNVTFHYYMAVVTKPGCPPDKLLYKAVSICKKCLTPKPPRTHHCSVCNKCILKMDHHCPWLNNCIGHYNHRYFFMYMLYTVSGSIFLILFGLPLAYDVLWTGQDESWTETEPLEGHAIKINETGHIIPILQSEMNENRDDFVLTRKNDLADQVMSNSDMEYNSLRRALIFMAFINVAVVIALGWLVSWHLKLIKHGETSIEAHTNRTEGKRMAIAGIKYQNPYDFGPKKNLELFFGLVDGRTFWRHFLLPSAHQAVGNGLSFEIQRTVVAEDFP